MKEVTYSKPGGRLLLIEIIGILLIIGIAIGATYAFFQYNKTGTKILSFETGSINLELGEVGMSQETTYNFTISGYNTGTEPIYYEVLAILGDDVGGKTRFNDDEIKLYITDGTAYWGGYLNYTTVSGWYGSLSINNQNMIETGTWYLGMVESNSSSYKKSICAIVKPLASGGTLTRTCEKTDVTATAKIGLPRMGEMFTSSDPNDYADSFLITSKSSTQLFSLSYASELLNPVLATSNRTKPTFYLKSNIYITGGNGTPSNPFVLAM